jgi:hypothetical protein
MRLSTSLLESTPLPHIYKQLHSCENAPLDVAWRSDELVGDMQWHLLHCMKGDMSKQVDWCEMYAADIGSMLPHGRAQNVCNEATKFTYW